MTPDACLVRNPDLIAMSLDDDLVMMHAEAGSYFSLNPVGAHIWEQLAQPLTLDALLQSVRDSFDAAPDAQMAQDVRAFVEKMIENDLVHVQSD